MSTRNRLFDDAARLAGGALGTLEGVRREIEALVRQQFERLLGSMDLVKREEFDAVKAMAAKARDEQVEMGARLDAMEKQLSGTTAKPPTRPASRAKSPARGKKKPAG
jgi:BMFP domain-containing protein YqiC